MRLQKFINEKYLTTVHVDWKHFDAEVFVNPSKRELREVAGTGYRGFGYRYLIDFKHKKIYVISENAFHETIMDAIPELPAFRKFWDNGVGREYIYTGDVAGGDHSSDALFARKYDGVVEELMAQDWKWVKRYLDADKIVKVLRDYFEDDTNFPEIDWDSVI